MDEIKLSVIIPMFNSECTIEFCLNSIFAYSTKNMEIILINDGSTDKTLEICEKYNNKYDNINLISYKENKGVGYARNLGLENSRGKYISFVDSDDHIKDDMLNTFLDIIERNNVDIVMCEIDQLFPDGTTIIHELKFSENIKDGTLVKDDIINFLNLNAIGNYTYAYLFAKVYKKSLFTDNNVHFVSNYAEDEIANYTILRKINSIYLLPKALYVHRIIKDSICGQFINPKIINEIKDGLIVLDKLFNEEEINKYIVDDFFMVKFLLEYQNPIFVSKLHNEEFKKNQRFILFGASSLGNEYMSMLERYNYYDIIFVDNDKNKQNTYIRSHKIISIDELKEIKKDDDFLIISSQYFVYIVRQLLDYKIINNISEVLISKDNTKIKDTLIDFFEAILINIKLA